MLSEIKAPRQFMPCRVARPIIAQRLAYCKIKHHAFAKESMKFLSRQTDKRFDKVRAGKTTRAYHKNESAKVGVMKRICIRRTLGAAECHRMNQMICKPKDEITCITAVLAYNIS